MTALQLAGILLTGGSVIMWLAAFFPTWRVHVTYDPEVRAKLIAEQDTSWILSHMLFLLGPVLTVMGMGVFTTTIEAANVRLLAIIAFVAYLLGMLVWAYIVLAFRLLMLGEEYVHTTAGGWTFPTYTVLTLGALILYGAVLLLSGFPAWLGQLTIGLNGLILIAFLIMKNSAPPLYYITTLIIGIVFLR